MEPQKRFQLQINTKLVQKEEEIDFFVVCIWTAKIESKYFLIYSLFPPENDKERKKVEGNESRMDCSSFVIKERITNRKRDTIRDATQEEWMEQKRNEEEPKERKTFIDWTFINTTYIADDITCRYEYEDKVGEGKDCNQWGIEIQKLHITSITIIYDMCSHSYRFHEHLVSSIYSLSMEQLSRCSWSSIRHHRIEQWLYGICPSYRLRLHYLRPRRGWQWRQRWLSITFLIRSWLIGTLALPTLKVLSFVENSRWRYLLETWDMIDMFLK